MSPKTIFATIGALVVAQMLTSYPALAGDLKVVVNGVRSDKGTVRVALFDGAEGFPRKRQVFKGAFAKAAKQSVAVTFKNVPPGKYAVALFHDEDGNEKVSSNLFGIPVEGFGFSNNVVGNFGPPGFEAASFDVSEANLTTSIKLNY